jgi:hypothetical protein
MRWRRLLVTALDDLSVLGRGQRALRATALTAALVAGLCGAVAGSPAPTTLLVLLAAAIWCAISPDSHAGLLVPLCVGWQWWAHLDRTTTDWALLAALGLLVFHSATSVAASVPAAATLPRAVVMPTALRTLVVGLATVAVWAAVRLSPLTGRTGHLTLTVAALLLTVVAAATVVLVRAVSPD